MRRFLAIGMAVAAALAWGASPVWAGATGFLIDPTSGPPGTMIHAESTSFSCGSGGGDDVTVSLVPDIADAPAIASVDVETVDEDPEWTADLTVPADAEPGEYLVTAHCSAFGGEQEFDYSPQSFVVTAAEVTTTTTTTTTTTVVAQATTTTTTVPVEPQAPPAPVVVAAPALTG